MEIIVARSAGFCKGVRRAIETVCALREKTREPIYTDGPLIHNPRIIGMLRERGIVTLEKAGEPSGGYVVIRAHGISPDRRKILEKMGSAVKDATCPDVAKVQAIVKEYSERGYRVVIVGDPGHAEVEGLLGCAGGKGIVVSDCDELHSVPRSGKVCVVAQTTQESILFQRLVEGIRNRAEECVVFDTICRSTKARQRETAELARRVEAMIVVGGRNSANTARLVRICEAEGVPTFHVEGCEEIPSIAREGYRRIGITAGASTPLQVVKEVTERLRAESEKGAT